MKRILIALAATCAIATSSPAAVEIVVGGAANLSVGDFVTYGGDTADVSWPTCSGTAAGLNYGTYFLDYSGNICSESHGLPTIPFSGDNADWPCGGCVFEVSSVKTFSYGGATYKCVELEQCEIGS